MFTLVQLRCFVAVAEELNLRRAARRLNITQPPLTRHMQGLEQQVGTVLLDRSGRGIRLTQAGEAFAVSARRLLEEADQAARNARRISGGDAGAVTIGFTAASSYVFLPGLIQTLRHELPAVSLTLRELTTPQQVAALQAGQLDFGLLRPPLSLVGIRTVRVFREALVVAVPATHPFVGWAEIGVQDLVDETLITYPPVEGPYFHRLVTGLLQVAGVSPAGLQYVTQTHSILSLVGAGLGVAIVPESAGSCLPVGVALRPLKDAAGVYADLVLAWPSRAANPSCTLVAQVATR